jgi:nucleoid DNA-binding protein
MRHENRTTLADLAHRAGLTYAQAAAFVQAILDLLPQVDEVRLGDLGAFRLSHLDARVVRAPVLPGGAATMPARATIRYTVHPYHPDTARLADLPAVAQRAGLDVRDVTRMVKAIMDELDLGREVRLQGLGVFRMADLPARQVKGAILPGGQGTIPARRLIRFKRFRTAGDRINQPERAAG